jgi:hypothetical protein
MRRLTWVLPVLAAAVTAAVVRRELPAIRRYLRISRM